ncbi:MAG: decaprenyl-phosphate phosphoribosyltransferase [Chloroflexi bacterium]|nr:decaprenyl-phosphate phosphoribosyltransferase [Chloroflexota bacterium]
MSKIALERTAAATGAQTLKYLLISMRPKQWTKNFMLFFGLIFSYNLRNPSLIVLTVAGFAIFCLLSSGIYLVNDLVDLEKDRKHPLKSKRPIASGKLPQALATFAAFLLLIVSIPLAFILNYSFGLIAVGYVTLMLAYSYGLKHLVLIDVFAIAAGFVLRAVAGAEAISVPISPWLYVCTALGALFLGLSKRRHELILLNDDATGHRKILEEYSAPMLDQMITIVTAMTIMGYSLYTFSAENLPRNNSMMLTIPFVLYGAFRYLYLIHLKNAGGSPEDILLKDKPLLLDVALWVVVSAGILYYSR